MSNGYIPITGPVADVLQRCRCDGVYLYLPEQLDRKLYEQTNKVLEALGGYWRRQMKAHRFDYEPADALDQALTSGYAIDQRKALNFFETPALLAQQLVQEAHLSPDDYVLEPSCGRGAIVKAILAVTNEVDVCEIHQPYLTITQQRYGAHVRHVGADFLAYAPQEPYDVIIANPPFSHQQDIAHVRHMLDLLAPNGRLVSVMSAGVTLRDNRQVHDLIAQLDTCFDWDINSLPDSTFASSGTLVRTALLTAQKIQND